MSKVSSTALDVLSVEIEGLQTLKTAMADEAADLSANFARAVALCLSVKGRLIVTGMGKSGHVARKIAATFASTGTPASYVHPGEASHGDLGMISEEDVILALSNSGETPELGDVLGYAGRFDIPLIAITAGAQSTLGKAADVLLLLPKAPEACGITKAPTTSTTMMMALGDALAVAALREKGFTATDFHKFHPGGKLGAALKRVTDIMHHRQMPLCQEAETIAGAVGIINQTGFGCVGVTDEAGRLVGMVTDGDLRRHFASGATTQTVAGIMTKSPHTIQEDGLAAEALGIISEYKITALFIVDEETRPLGLLHVHDCLAVGVL